MQRVEFITREIHLSSTEIVLSKKDYNVVKLTRKMRILFKTLGGVTIKVARPSSKLLGEA